MGKDELATAMKAKSDERNQWKRCPPGEVARVAEGLRRRRRTRIVKHFAPMTALLLTMLGVSAYLTSQLWHPGDYDFGGITCTEVRADIPQMMAGTLDQETMMRIQRHLEKCPHCKPLAEKMHDQMQKMQKDIKMGHADRQQPDCPCGLHDRLIVDRGDLFRQLLAGAPLVGRGAR